MAENPLPQPQRKRPTINLPPRPCMETLFTGGFSPGPMTLASTFLGDNNNNNLYDYPSFSQLLAGAMGSPLAAVNLRPGFSTDNPMIRNGDFRDEKNLGFRQNRPMNLMVARSPMFTVPPGLSPSGFLNSPGFFSPQSPPFGISHQQALAQVTAQAVLAQSHIHMPAQQQASSVSNHLFFNQDEAPQKQQTPPLNSNSNGHTIDQNYQPSTPFDKPNDDGYSWRKYGQKPIKGCGYPRSYYKCTHPKCPVKKKLERSAEGHITEIIYKGMHNHEKPQPQLNRHGKDGTDLDGNINSNKARENTPPYILQIREQENTPPYILQSREQQTPPSAPMQLRGSTDEAETIEAEREEDKQSSKRRKTDVVASSAAVPEKSVTEAKIVVQTRSEVDLLDDGFRWRKYGQKLVKGNPNPRSYYKCTSAGCNVRKHVERASADPKAVITTYEGKHNHDVPTAKNSNLVTANTNAMQLKPHNVAVYDQKPFLFN